VQKKYFITIKFLRGLGVERNFSKKVFINILIFNNYGFYKFLQIYFTPTTYTKSNLSIVHLRSILINASSYRVLNTLILKYALSKFTLFLFNYLLNHVQTHFCMF